MGPYLRLNSSLVSTLLGPPSSSPSSPLILHPTLSFTHIISPSSSLLLSGLGIRSFAGLGICSSVSWAHRSFFAKKWVNKQFGQKNEHLAHSLIFGERPEQIAHGHSFLVSDLSDSLTSLIFGEWPERFAHIAHQKRGNEWIYHFLKKKTYIKK